LGFTYVEMNASDIRSKRVLNEALGAAVSSCTLYDFFGKLPTNVSFHVCLCLFVDYSVHYVIVWFDGIASVSINVELLFDWPC